MERTQQNLHEDSVQMMMLFYKPLERATRRAMSDDGFLTTIHNMIDVASERPYLDVELAMPKGEWT